jgi:hypothetical protein
MTPVITGLPALNRSNFGRAPFKIVENAFKSIITKTKNKKGINAKD